MCEHRISPNYLWPLRVPGGEDHTDGGPGYTLGHDNRAVQDAPHFRARSKVRYFRPLAWALWSVAPFAAVESAD